MIFLVAASTLLSSDDTMKRIEGGVKGITVATSGVTILQEPVSTSLPRLWQYDISRRRTDKRLASGDDASIHGFTLDPKQDTKNGLATVAKVSPQTTHLVPVAVRRYEQAMRSTYCSQIDLSYSPPIHVWKS